MTTVWHENNGLPVLNRNDLHQAALGMLEARRAMRGTLPAALIHDVALELLLTLFLSRSQVFEIDGLLAEATVPVGAAQRWLSALAAEDLVRIDSDHATLTSVGIARMTGMLTAVVMSQRRLLGWADH